MMAKGFMVFLFVTILSFLPGGPPVLADQPYQGALFDAHAHLSGRSNPKQAYADFKGSGFEKAVLFTEVYKAKDIAKVGKGFFLVFNDPFKRDNVKIGGRKKTYYLWGCPR